MSDKEIVFQAINKYAKDLASNLFHFNSVAILIWNCLPMQLKQR